MPYRFCYAGHSDEPKASEVSGEAAASDWSHLHGIEGIFQASISRKEDSREGGRPGGNFIVIFQPGKITFKEKTHILRISGKSIILREIGGQVPLIGSKEKEDG